jgi:hypothetical protein
MVSFCAWALLAGALSAETPARPCERPDLGAEPWRIIVVVAGEGDPAVASAIAAAGANVLATLSPPNAAADAACEAAGISYLARIPALDVAALPFHPERVAAIRALHSLVALQVIDLDALEGYETPDTQAFAYATLKALFPDLLVVHALRLDPIGWDPGYLERFYRPELCDVVAPYFYPVGATYLGTFEENGSWPETLRSLLEQVAARTPAPTSILPVLQAFEQSGHPVSRALLDRQVAIYRQVWPGSSALAAFWWGDGLDEPLTGLAERPDLRASVAAIFGAAPSRAHPCIPVGSRPPVQFAP